MQPLQTDGTNEPENLMGGPGSRQNSMVNTVERQGEPIPNMIGSASNSNVQNTSLSGIRNEEEARKSFIECKINKVGDAEGDNSAILEGNMILGALNSGGGTAQLIGGDQNNNSSSFLKNESGHAEDQADGSGTLCEKPANSSGIMWLSGPQT